MHKVGRVNLARYGRDDLVNWVKDGSRRGGEGDPCYQ